MVTSTAIAHRKRSAQRYFAVHVIGSAAGCMFERMASRCEANKAGAKLTWASHVSMFFLCDIYVS